MKLRPQLIKHQVLPADNSLGAVRYILALGILLGHFTVLTGMGDFLWIPSYQIVGGFFALSGFLIFKSYHRASSGSVYLRDRAARIMPSYITVVLACFLLLSMVSTLGISDYFASPQTWRYLACNLVMANFAAPDLPGVFTATDIHAVNGSLWTMKVEWCLYLSIFPAAWLIIKKRLNPMLVIAAIYILSATYRYIMYRIFLTSGLGIFDILARQFGGQMTYFYAGVLLYCYYQQASRYIPMVAIVGAVAFAGCHYFRHIIEVTIILSPAAVTATVLGFGLWGRWGAWTNRFVNSSYEIYLFHCPVIQLIANSTLPTHLGMAGCLVVAIVGTFAVSYLCARFISDPLRRRLRK